LPAAGHERTSVAAHEPGHRIEIWKLRRDTGLSAAELSRVLRTLHQRGYIELYTSLDPLEAQRAGNDGGKFVRLTDAGADHLKFQQHPTVKP
jgi:DNA-binding MarR family transcriptional regulator